EAGPLLVRLPVLHVDLLVRDVPVAADHELAAARAHRFQPRQEPLHELVLARLRLVTRGSRGHVERDHAERAEIELQEAALRVDLLYPQPEGRLVRLLRAIDRHTAVAALLGGMEE